MSFKRRTRPVFLYLQDVERLESAITGGELSPSLTITTLPVARATSFLVFYNVLEATLAEALADVREQIAADTGAYETIGEAWRIEILRFHLRDLLSAGCSYETLYKRMDSLMSRAGLIRLTAREIQDLPFPGNINQTRLCRWATRLGLAWQAPTFCKGGRDLEDVWRHRNDLAHGKESFVDVGNLYTVAEIRVKFLRGRAFIKALLVAFERYVSSHLYRN